MTEVKYLIIGNSAGAIGAAEAIRQVDKTGTMAIVSDEPYPAYSRVRISGALAYKYPIEKILFRPADFYESNGIRTIFGRKAEKLDIAGHSVTLDDGSVIEWQKLLLATGGLPIVPPIKGGSSRGVFSFTTFDDAQAIDKYLDNVKEAVIIGGGLIGVSASEALNKRGVKVNIVEMKDRVLNAILDEEASAIEAKAMQKAGINIITGNTVAEITADGNGCVNGVKMGDDSALPCQMVIIAIGVTPRTELVKDTGIEMNRGIVVDEKMETSASGVYACGDVVESYDFVYGQKRLTPIWPNAYTGGRIAGFNMAGAAASYGGGTSMNTMKYFGVNIVSAGITMPPDDSYKTIINRENGAYRKVLVKDSCVAGLLFAGDIEKSGIILGLMRDKADVSGYADILVTEGFGLTCLPDEIWKPKLATAAEAAEV